MQKSEPLVTVVVITYNQHKYIRQAMDSFLAQKTDFGIEILVHDDASTDGTEKILKEYRDKYPYKVRLLLEKENQFSKTGAKFLGDMYSLAGGKYIAVCEGDDYWTDPEKLQRQVDYLESNPKYTICFHPVTVRREHTNKKELFPVPVEGHIYTLKELLQHNYIQTNSVMYRNLRNYGGVCPDGILPQDWFTHIFHARHGKIGFINKPMAVYRIHSKGMWHDSHVEADSIWGKYGVQWLGMYIAVHNLFVKDKEYRTLTEGNIINAVRTIFELSGRYPDQITQAISKYPDAAILYIGNLREQLDDLHAHSDKQSDIIRHYTERSDSLLGENQALRKHIETIESSIPYRLYKGFRNNKEMN